MAKEDEDVFWSHEAVISFKEKFEITAQKRRGGNMFSAPLSWQRHPDISSKHFTCINVGMLDCVV